MTQTDLIQRQARCIAHEIRNHISICDVYTEIIRKQLENSGVKNDSVNNALGCISKSLKIISNSLTDLKSLNNLKLKKCDLRELLFQSMEMSKVYVQDKHVTFKLNANAECLADIDENKFLACVVNLIKNAIESIEETGVIEITLIKESNLARITVLNNGAQIPPEKQEEIFKDGFTTKNTGSGLGLYICKNNLASQNAELSLLKSDEESTVFEIKIPL